MDWEDHKPVADNCDSYRIFSVAYRGYNCPEAGL